MVGTKEIKRPQAIFSFEAAKEFFVEGWKDLTEKFTVEVKAEAVQLEEVQQEVVQAETEEKPLTAREERRLRKAESRYERVRDKLIEASSGYTKKSMEVYNRIFDELNKLTAAEKKEFMDLIKSGVRKPIDAASRKYEPVFDALDAGVKAKVITWDKSKKLLEFGLNAAIGVGKIATDLTATLAGQPYMILGVEMAANALKQGLMAAINKLDKREEIGGILSNEVMKKNIKAIESDIKTLMADLEGERKEWIEKAKTMKAKDFEAAFADHISEKITELNLNDISSRLMNDVVKKRGRKKSENATGLEAKTEEQASENKPAQKPTVPEVKEEDKKEEIIEELGV